LDRRRLQYQLRDNARVGPNGLWIVVDEEDAWRENLLHSLDILTAGA